MATGVRGSWPATGTSWAADDNYRGDFTVKRTVFIVVSFALLLCLAACATSQSMSAGSSPGTKSNASLSDEVPASEISPSPSENPVQPNNNSGVFDDIDNLEFSALSDLEFWFGSGAGAWSTVVTILSDGTFNGYYHDSEAGSSDDDYPNGTRYECYFSGKFSSLKKTGDYEYSMKCELLQLEGTPGEEKIIDGVKLITSEPYGFDNADEFFLYLPGKKTSELSEEFLSWSHGSASDGVLTCYGLYNAGGEQGFIVWPE